MGKILDFLRKIGLLKAYKGSYKGKDYDLLEYDTKKKADSKADKKEKGN